MPDQSTSGQTRPKLFISHKFDDMRAARTVASRLKMISSKLDIFLASAPEFAGPRIGKSLNADLKKVLGETSLVLLIFSAQEKDWSWCMWECGVATDPSDETPTKVVTLSLTEEAPKPYEDTLMVKASDQKSVQAFVNQLCTQKDFFPSLGGPLTDRIANDDFTKEQSGSLYNELEQFTRDSKIKEEKRWSGFTISMEGNAAEALKSRDSCPSGDDLAEVLRELYISAEENSGVSHFGYTAIMPDMTLADLLTRWRAEQGRGQDASWPGTIVDELWRIATARRTNPSWKPFLSVKEKASESWVYPIVYNVRIHPSGRFEFDLQLIHGLSQKA